MAYLRIANLKKTYQVSRTEKQDVLKGVDIEFKRGEFVALLGESGCGKSTFINIIGGLDFEYTGSVVLDGFFLRDFSEKELDDYRKKKIGFIFQNYNLINHMTVMENIMIAMTMSSVPHADRLKRAKELLVKVGLEGHNDKLPNQLSGGQRQRVAIARSLANDPDIILADEPTGSLDKESSDQIIQILTGIADSGKLVIAVTHSSKVASHCSRIVKLDDGIIVSDETLRKVDTNTPKPKNIKPKSIDLWETVKLAFSNLLQNRGRSILVSVGMSIGIAAVVLMFSLSSGIKAYISNEVSTSMNNLQIDVVKESGGAFGSSNNFSTSDINFLSTMSGVESYVKSTSLNLTVQYKSQTTSFQTLLFLSTTFEGFKPSLLAGEAPESGEILISNAIAYNIGTMKSNGSIDYAALLGTTITIKTADAGTKYFTVSGVMDSSSEISPYAYAYVPYDDLLSMYNAVSLDMPTTKIYLFASDISYIDTIVSDVNILGYTAIRQDTTVEDLLAYVDLGTLVLTEVSAISLLVSAIMIFIVLYISVVERTKEIGILRAIGARRKDVRRIFVLEAGFLGLLGGIIGCSLSFIIGVVTNSSLAADYSTNFVDNNLLYFLIGIAASVVISVISGLSPAAKAANADPVESLRYE